MGNRLPQLENTSPPAATVVDWVYLNRAAWWLWGLFLAVSLLLFVSLWAVFHAIDSTLLHTMGPWLAIVLISGAPFAWLVWVVRDRGKTEELRIRVSSNAQRVFEKLQEWTNGDNATLQAAAIYQLRPFIFGESGGLIPKELTGKENPFAQPGMEILRALLDDRSWLKAWGERFPDTAGIKSDPGKAHGRAPRSPVLRAIESILRNEHLPHKDFSDWNLSGLDLRHAFLNHASFINANLEGTNFSEAHLVGAIFVGAQMKDAMFNDAHLESANLSHSSDVYLPYHVTNLENVKFVNAHLESANLQWSNLKDSKFMFSHLVGANFGHAELAGADFFKANLEDVNFRGADLSNAKIDREWQGIFDWISLELEGQPEIV